MVRKTAIEYNKEYLEQKKKARQINKYILNAPEILDSDHKLKMWDRQLTSDIYHEPHLDNKRYED